MLCALTIRNFAIIESAQLELEGGLSVITGETGAGKSILMEALGVVLGQRLQTSLHKQTDQKLSVSAMFDVSQNRQACAWLKANDLESDDECIMRRTFSQDGRSRAYVNDTPVPLTRLKELGSLLVDMVGQNTHQFLMSKKNHLQILDAQCAHDKQLETLKQTYRAWSEINNRLQELRDRSDTNTEKLEWLKHQIRELDEMAPVAGEFEELEAEHERLSKIDTLIELAQTVRAALVEGDERDVSSDAARLIRQLEPYAEIEPKFGAAKNELAEALTHLEAAGEEIKSMLNNVEMDRGRFDEVENRLSKYLELARKYRVPAKQLADLHRDLSEQLTTMENPETQIADLEEQLNQHAEAYRQLAETVSKKRRSAARKWSKEISQILHKLNMPDAELDVRFVERADQPCAHGMDDVELMVKTNAGQALQPLTQVASGGEISRINLAIQTSLTQNHPVTTVVFDEVDSGVGGTTAETIGTLLQQAAKHVQVLCITHLSQIASCAHHHYRVQKTKQQNGVVVSVDKLHREERSFEIARMMAGTKVTENTLAHAREILDQ